MPPFKVRRHLVSSVFHRELKKRMEASCFTFMHTFLASNGREGDRYCASALYVQETTHFFYLPNKGFLIQFALRELITEGDVYEATWSVGTYLQLDTHKMASEAYNDRILESVGTLWGPFLFRSNSRVSANDNNSYGWQLKHSGACGIAELVVLACDLRTHFAKFLQPTLSSEFSTYDFINLSAWPGLDERFWGRFPSRLLREIAQGAIHDKHPSL